jgi:hypothetical protein
MVLSKINLCEGCKEVLGQQLEELLILFSGELQMEVVSDTHFFSLYRLRDYNVKIIRTQNWGKDLLSSVSYTKGGGRGGWGNQYPFFSWDSLLPEQCVIEKNNKKQYGLLCECSAHKRMP